MCSLLRVRLRSAWAARWAVSCRRLSWSRSKFARRKASKKLLPRRTAATKASRVSMPMMSSRVSTLGSSRWISASSWSTCSWVTCLSWFRCCPPGDPVWPPASAVGRSLTPSCFCPAVGAEPFWICPDWRRASRTRAESPSADSVPDFSSFWTLARSTACFQERSSSTFVMGWPLLSRRPISRKMSARFCSCLCRSSWRARCTAAWVSCCRRRWAFLARCSGLMAGLPPAMAPSCCST